MSNPTILSRSAVCLVLICVAGCASKEKPPVAMAADMPFTQSSSPPVTVPPETSTPTRVAAQPSIVPGSLKDFQLNVGDSVYFSFDSSTLDDASHAVLQKQAAWLERYRDVTLQVQGNSDERGTREYNLALGARRATSVREYLVTLGVAPGRVDTISYGKEHPICVESSESCWSQNRRAVSAISGETSRNVAMR